MIMESDHKTARRLLLTACIISFVCFLGAYMRIPIVPLLATSLGADTVQVGMINGAFMLMAGVLSIPAGLISDRVGRRLPLLGGMILLGGSALLLYWSYNLVQVAGTYLLFGIGLSAFSPTLMSYVADVTPSEVLGQAYGWYTMALYGGMTLGPAAGGVLSKALGLRSVFLISGGLICVMLFVAHCFLPPPATRRATSHPAVIPVLKELLKNRRLVAYLVATVGGSIGFGMFVTFIPLYSKSLGMDTGDVGLVFASQALSNAMSRLPSGKLCDRGADPGTLVVYGLSLFALSVAAFAICGSVASLMVAAAVMGVSMGVSFTVICAQIADVVSPGLRGLAMGFYNTSVFLGMMLSSIGMGAVIKGADFKTGFWLCGVVVMGAMFHFKFQCQRQHATG